MHWLLPAHDSIVMWPGHRQGHLMLEWFMAQDGPVMPVQVVHNKCSCITCLICLLAMRCSTATCGAHFTLQYIFQNRPGLALGRSSGVSKRAVLITRLRIHHHHLP